METRYTTIMTIINQDISSWYLWSTLKKPEYYLKRNGDLPLIAHLKFIGKNVARLGLCKRDCPSL